MIKFTNSDYTNSKPVGIQMFEINICLCSLSHLSRSTVIPVLIQTSKGDSVLIYRAKP